MFEWIHEIPPNPADWHVPHLSPWMWALVVFEVAKKIVFGAYLVNRWHKRRMNKNKDNQDS